MSLHIDLSQKHNLDSRQKHNHAGFLSFAFEVERDPARLTALRPRSGITVESHALRDRCRLVWPIDHAFSE